ncbi:PAS domain S-box protein [Flavobacterium hiemivividum]|uniref:histidine kinase n=1 Tax=Flavobacterium hiemivividum TaxID=2541734 RepID=A0A4R5CPL3_9FLAO|nr:PAS domain-containing protein [Flavobacterium hiemivividum]TDE01250.1 PAS domain S-box protein [Flavobacterium hiemivividum]
MATERHSNSLVVKTDFYKKLLSESTDLIFHMTISKDGTFFFPFLSKSVITHFNLTSEEISSDAFAVLKSKIVAEDLRGFLQSIDESKKDLKTWAHEFRATVSNKGILWFKGIANVEYTEDNTINFYGKVTEVTEYKRQELKLKLSEERFQFALEASSEGIWDYNIKEDKIFFCSQSMKILGFKEEDTFHAIDIWENRIHPLDKEKYLSDVQLHIDNVTTNYENSKRILTKSGDYKWILTRGKIIERDSNNNPIRVMGTHTDISSQKEKEDEIIKSLEVIGEQNNRLLNFAYIVSHNLRSHAGNIEMLLNIMEDEKDEASLKETNLHLRSSSLALTETIEHLKELVEIQTELNHKSEKLNLNAYITKTLAVLGTEISKNKVVIQNSISNEETITFNAVFLESILFNLTSNAIKYSREGVIPVISYTILTEESRKTLVIKDNGLGVNLKSNGDKQIGIYKTLHNNHDCRDIALFITQNKIKAMGGSIEVESIVGEGTVFKIHFNDEV